ncbi:uncharacterized protein LOC121981160 isoform X2 [Zingiber officinale]|uniref:uncharacterized protein LOC121981160 isoform X2 n=1 Tax=Zingiber officinale TaxID=94328 RepID=UPI001C4C2C3B|nr:uncharacterized protein LOC121981160 isoform X2 [Zingiber officinale]XP_042389478.1 uncharacterized protein LOC121981160 isoform X2 [Zingiber officinale]XP_042389479.1 uncharacterized protein LOC121981160 isoform X2 [Zingiber officinale]XP_042389480.1 uncharacterized protein LOC121981160 isoform X2 [Zingiber officinale]XP_042389481.1 uncharacterized protein LOC121981160 isoform X2 [Zingiber officinale]
MDPYFHNFGGGMENQYFQSEHQFYPNMDQQNRYESFSNAFNANLVDNSCFRYESAQVQFIESYPIYQNSYGFQEVSTSFMQHPYQQNYSQMNESTWKLKEIMQQMSEYQEQQFSRIQNIQSQLDQITSSVNQLQTQSASEEVDCGALVKLDIASTTLLDSLSTFYCCDDVVEHIFDFTDIVAVDVENDADIIVEDDLSVGDYLLGVLPQESPRIEDVSVGTCGTEPSTQELLHEDMHSLEPEHVSLFEEKEVTNTTLGTFQHDKENISFRSGCLN